VNFRNQLWETYVQKDTNLLTIADRIWQAPQRLNLSSEYSGVDNMIAISNQLEKLSMSIKVQVKLQASRLKALNVLNLQLKLGREIIDF
jgi:hypothetical protein